MPPLVEKTTARGLPLITDVAVRWLAHRPTEVTSYRRVPGRSWFLDHYVKTHHLGHFQQTTAIMYAVLRRAAHYQLPPLDRIFLPTLEAPLTETEAFYLNTALSALPYNLPEPVLWYAMSAGEWSWTTLTSLCPIAEATHAAAPATAGAQIRRRRRGATAWTQPTPLRSPGAYVRQTACNYAQDAQLVACLAILF